MSKQGFHDMLCSMDAVTNKGRLLTTMNLFDLSLSNLMKGSTDEPQTIAPPSSSRMSIS